MIQIFLAICILLSSCTYSINQVSTKGTASDVIDETQAASPDVSPEISIPASLVGAQGVESIPMPKNLTGIMQPV